MIPVILAVWGTAQKGFFYLYDISTDVEVIRELKDIPEVTLPKIPKVKIRKFLLEAYKTYGLDQSVRQYAWRLWCMIVSL